MAGEPSQRSGPFTIFLMVACAALSVLVVLLAIQNLGLKKQLAGRPAALEALKPGERLGSLTLRDASGASRPLDFGRGENRTLLLVFSVHCPACEQTFPVWDDLVRGLGAPAGLRVVGVQTDRPGPDSDPGAVVTSSFPYDVYGLDHEASEAMKHIPYIPATIVVDRQGMVERVWFGPLTEETVGEVREAVGVAAG